LETERKERKLQKEAQQAQRARMARAKKLSEDDREAMAADLRSGQTGQDIVIDGVCFSEDPTLPDPSFTFVYPESRLTADELDDIIHYMGRDFAQGNPLLKALHRGVGIHHAGLPKKYRQAVEVLFRCRHLRVVVATGTLAYGIHMPCRTVVLSGDSVFLNALNFQQMGGRAGRRGLDDMGHVVFYGTPSHKIHRVRRSALPNMKGQYPLSVSLTLRLLVLHRELGVPLTAGTLAGKRAGDKEMATASMLGLLQSPFFAHVQPHLGQQLQHTFRFGLQYLQNHGLINSAGEPTGLAPLATHLFWTEPSNFAFCCLLNAGILDEICERCGGDWPILVEELLVVLAHLFCVVPLRLAAPDVPALQRALRGASPSKVVLPPMPHRARLALEAHDKAAFRSLRQCIQSYADAHPEIGGDERPHSLPLSGVTVSRSPRSTADRIPKPWMALEAARIHFSACSPFAALCGAGDDFQNLGELMRWTSRRIVVHPTSLPLSRTPVDFRGLPVAINAYALDYFKHRQKQALVRANGLMEGTAWEQLKQFSSVLSAISVALSAGQVGGGAVSQVARAMDRLSREFREAFEAFNSPHSNGGHGA
ncbi:unnamed protein product, partial [Ostreobium quekettii]